MKLRRDGRAVEIWRRWRRRGERRWRLGIRRWRLVERRRVKERIQAREVHEEMERRRTAFSIVNGDGWEWDCGCLRRLNVEEACIIWYVCVVAWRKRCKFFSMVFFFLLFYFYFFYMIYGFMGCTFAPNQNIMLC